MKKILVGLVSLFLGSMLMVSCSSENEMMSQFSKRKYLKNFKDKNVKHKDVIKEIDNSIDYAVASDEYASTEIEPTQSSLDEIIVEDNSVMIELNEEKTKQIESVNSYPKDYSQWNGYNRKMDFSKMEVNLSTENIRHNKVSSNQADAVVLIILSIFIPPLAVFLYEDSITNNFWVDLILTLLFWLPGMIFAFLVCFAGVSV